MDYNTARSKLVIREYGRNIQTMIEHLLTIEDRKKRTEMANFVVNVMAQMNPQNKDVGDVKHKLWDHLYIISNFKLDVDSPFPPPSPKEVNQSPKRLGYQSNNIRYRHYGKNLAMIIEKAIAYEDGEEKNALIQAIANHMKKSYLNWNRDSVNDELIIEHLKVLSKDQLQLTDDMRLNNTNDILARNRKKKHDKKSNPGSQRRGKKDNWDKR